MPSPPPRTDVPEQGQLVEVRRRPWLVKDVHPGALSSARDLHHRVTLESLDEQLAGEELQVVWEREVRKRVLAAAQLPQPTRDWDPLKRLEAFLLATRWSLASLLETLPVQSPFKGAIDPEDFQLEAVIRALGMPRVNLLIADFVGAGKTIEAGLVMQELLARQRARRVLVVCPASLQVQWQEEMEQKFALRFEIVDRDYVNRLRREYGMHVNPWNSFPRLITSMDFLKRIEPLNSFRSSLQRKTELALRDWDLLIVDEAHNVAPQGRGRYVQASDRTHMVRDILPHFEHRLFLTATPHNGYTESFTALLEMLDPLRFTRGKIQDRTTFEQHRDAVMIRRVKEEIVDDLGKQRFPKRIVDPPLEVTLEDREKRLVDLLDDYTHSMTRHSEAPRRRLAVRFALTMLKKRLLSSPKSFSESLKVHHCHLESPDLEEDDESIREQELAEASRRLEEELDDDEEKARLEEQGMQQASSFFKVTPEEREMVDEMLNLITEFDSRPDTKCKVLMGAIEEELFSDGEWNEERLVVFTEYRDTLDYLDRELSRQGWGDRLMHLTGGMGSRERESIKKAFRAHPSEHPVRILLATDAASEGLNLQDHCRRLIHYEIPWNPNKLEQRNGRIDRKGQRSKKVYCRHFAYTNNEDQRFLDVIISKVKNQQEDLGAVGDVVARQVTGCMLGESSKIEDEDERIKILREDLGAEARSSQQMREEGRKRVLELREKLVEARETWRLSPENMARVLREALLLEGGHKLKPVLDGPLADIAWEATQMPWPECRRYLHDGEVAKKLVFTGKLPVDDPRARRKDVELIHLDHPIMRRALALFRTQLWSRPDEEGRLSRVSYKVVDSSVTDRIHLIAFARLVAVNAEGHKVHEELVPLGGALRGLDLEPVSQGELERLAREKGSWPEISVELGEDLRKLFQSHRDHLQQSIERLKEESGEGVREALEKNADQAAENIRQLIDQRRKELNARIRKLKNLKETSQASFDFKEEEAMDEDLNYLESRLARLAEERREEPETVRRRLQMAPDGLRVFPLALLYVIPSSTEGVLGTRDRGGVVRYTELYELLHDFERYLREAIQRAHPEEGWTRFLTPEKLEELYEVQEKKEAPLILCLYLADFIKIAVKSDPVRELLDLPEVSNTQLKKLLGPLGRLRNPVMHHDLKLEDEETLAKIEARRDDLASLVDTFERAAAKWEEGR